jgi:sugar phosphate isomerase/epimerase
MIRPLGVCTWTFGAVPLPAIATTLARLGYDGVELAGDLDACGAAEAKAVLAGEGLDVFSLTPANVDISTPDAGTRRAAIDYYLRLVDFAAALGGATMSIHGLVGRIAPLATQAEEDALLEAAVAEIVARAHGAGVPTVFEVLNRYESHQVNTGAAALALVGRIGVPSFKVLLDAYHMNIEEPDPAGAIEAAGARLGLFHLADSNRDAIGGGHMRVPELFAALDRAGYGGPVIMECTPPGPNPFTPVKGPDSAAVLAGQLARSREALLALS